METVLNKVFDQYTTQNIIDMGKEIEDIDYYNNMASKYNRSIMAKINNKTFDMLTEVQQIKWINLIVMRDDDDNTVRKVCKSCGRHIMNIKEQFFYCNYDRCKKCTDKFINNKIIVIRGVKF